MKICTTINLYLFIKNRSSQSISRVLYAVVFRCQTDKHVCHLSTRLITKPLYRPTLLRRYTGISSDGSPSIVGIHGLSTSEVHAPRCHHPGGGLLHTPSHPYHKWMWRLFSSALLSLRRLLPVRKRNTLCCPDFPRVSWYHFNEMMRLSPATDRLAAPLYVFVCKVKHILENIDYCTSKNDFFTLSKPQSQLDLSFGVTIWIDFVEHLFL